MRFWNINVSVYISLVCPHRESSNPRSIALEATTLTIISLMWSYNGRGWYYTLSVMKGRIWRFRGHLQWWGAKLYKTCILPDTDICSGNCHSFIYIYISFPVLIICHSFQNFQNFARSDIDKELSLSGIENFIEYMKTIEVYISRNKIYATLFICKGLTFLQPTSDTKCNARIVFILFMHFVESLWISVLKRETNRKCWLNQNQKIKKKKRHILSYKCNDT
jgi:hypothetical protein